MLGNDIFTREEDEPSLLAAVASIDAIIDAEITEHGIPSERIVVGGISQGGALACLTAITSIRRLGGAFMLSTYVPLLRKTKEVNSPLPVSPGTSLSDAQIATPTASLIPMYWAHGQVDRQVDHDKAFNAASELALHLDIPIVHLTERAPDSDPPTEPGIRFRSYASLGHWIDPSDELCDLAAWIRSVLPQEETPSSKKRFSCRLWRSWRKIAM